MDKYYYQEYLNATVLRVKNARFTLFKQGEKSFLVEIVRVKREGEEFSVTENTIHQEVIRGKLLVTRSRYSAEGIKNLFILLSVSEKIQLLA